MKKTLHVNIGSVAFTLDEDAYHTLKDYYEDVESRLSASERHDIMEDIESRTADIFRENLTFPTQVVNIDLVKHAISTIGSPQTFGENYGENRNENTANRNSGRDHNRTHNSAHNRRNNDGRPRKLYRLRDDKIIGGVCSGVARYLDIDVNVVRILTFLFIFLGGLTIWVYIIMWILVPLEPREYNTCTDSCANNCANNKNGERQ